LDFLSADVSDGSNRGPPGAAAVMCAPTPTLLRPICLLGPPVGARQSGFEHRWPTSCAMYRRTGFEKLSRPPSFASGFFPAGFFAAGFFGAGFFAVNFFPLLFLTTTTR